MNKNIISKSVFTLILLAAGIGTSVAGSDKEKLIAHARAAAPAAIGAGATIVINGEVVVEGSNGWTCLPDTMPGDGAAVCIDALWGEMMAAVERVPGVMEVFGAGRRGARAHFRMDWLSPFGDIMFPPSVRDQILGYCRPCCNKGPEREVVVDVELTTPLASPASRGGIVKSVTEIV